MVESLVKYDDRGLVWLRAPEDLEELEEIMTALSYFQDNLPWVWGDFVNKGQEVFGELFYQVLPDPSRTPKTLASWAFVCRRIPMDRRCFDVTFSHYKEVVKLPDVEQDVLLDMAEKERWSVARLREQVKGGSGESASRVRRVVCPKCGHEFEAR